MTSYYPAIRGESVYTIIDGPSWTEAEGNENKPGGHFITINEDDENNFISTLPLNNGNFISYIRLNYFDKSTNNNFHWVPEEKVNYLNLGRLQADDPNIFDDDIDEKAYKTNKVYKVDGILKEWFIVNEDKQGTGYLSQSKAQARERVES